MDADEVIQRLFDDEFGLLRMKLATRRVKEYLLMLGSSIWTPLS